jgi:putative acetyltransferase
MSSPQMTTTKSSARPGPRAPMTNRLSALIEALTKLAQARGAKRLTVDASDSARPLFERQGFTAERRNLVRVGDQWLANTTMAKTLVAESASPTRH